MTFPADDILLGPASFGRLHRLDGLILHTGEEPAFTRDYAVSTAIWQRTNSGSYNFRVYDQASDPRGVMLNVPYLEASGGINPASAAWAPGRFPFLERELAKAGKCPVSGCPGPYRNPTLHHLQISFVGRTDQLDAALAPADYLTNALRLIAWADSLPNRGPAPLVPSKHGHWQSNRSDCGDWMYSRLTATTQEDDMQYWKPVEELWDTAIGTQFWDGGGVAKTFTATERVRSIAESSDGKYRLIAYGSDELLVLDRWARTRPTPVPGSRVPATDYGFPPASVVEVPTGITPEQLAQAQRQEFIRGRDEGTAAYAAAGALAAQAVTP